MTQSMKQNQTVDELLDKGLERAMNDVTRLLSDWQTNNRVATPGVAFLALELVLRVGVKEHGLDLQQIRVAAGQLVPKIEAQWRPRNQAKA